ncbi:Wzy polymerase domain-containing protein, partial [Ideonella sp.]|uniref:Wzy polymerase domain-containing protein n=1 Tax=Ideonella sp. TaxID=1929293 RepID=UPI003BB506A0
RAQSGSAGPAARAALMMVLLAGVHSMLEYPLWYAYFLLPTAWALGHALRPPAATEQPALATEAPATRGPALSRIAGALMLAGALFATWDYLRVTVIYQPGDTAAPLNERIADGERAWLFGHHASYAAATTAEPRSQAMASFASTTHSLLDTRLMLAWAQALKESGHLDKARYVAARLREFRNPASAEFFAPCSQAATETEPLPWQCQAPTQALSWRDFQR